MSKALKSLVLEHLEVSGSLEYTRQTLRRLQEQVQAQIGKLEMVSGCENWVLKLLMQKLGI